MANRVAIRDMGTALRFDGVDDFVEVPDASIPASVFQNGFTVSAWINFKTLGENSQARIIDKSSGSGQFGLNGLTLSLNNNDSLACVVNNGTVISTGANSLLGLRRKYFLASATVASDGTINVAINGTVLGTGVSAALSGITTTNALRIGQRSTATDRTFDGIIDEPRIWSRALTAEEIWNLYFNNIVPTSSLVGEYLFNETSGSTVLDTSGNGKDGTITGATYTTDVPLKPRTAV